MPTPSVSEQKPTTPVQPKLYSTTDQTMVQALLMLRHSPDRVEMDSSTGQLVYHFHEEEVSGHIKLLQTNHAGELTITIEDWWRAQTTWQMNLRHFARNTRR